MAGPHVCEGFDALTTADLSIHYQVNGSVSVDAAYGRLGSQGLRCDGGGSNLVAAVAAAPSSFVSGFAMRPVSGLGDDHIAQLVDGHDFTGGPILTLHVNADGSIEIRRGLTTYGYLVTIGTLVWCSAPDTIRLHVWNTVEWKGTIHASAGAVSLKVNGETLCALTGINTTGDGSSNLVTRASLGCHAHTIDFDDWWLADQSGDAPNDFLGDRVVEASMAETGNGHYAEWTPSSGSDHGAMVDDVESDGDATYNAADTADLRDTYTFPALARVESVDAVQVILVARKEGAGTRAIAGLTRAGGTDTVDGTDHYLADSYAAYRVPLPLNPTTGDPWTLSEANAVELGATVTI